MSDLVEFLTARLDEDEAGALAASKGHVWAWESDTYYYLSSDVEDYPGHTELIVEIDSNNPSVGAAEHIARWDPARVLAEVKAKRDILDLHYDMASNYTNWTFDKDYHACFCHEGINGTWPCETVRAIASIYADHPDFDPAWRT